MVGVIGTSTGTDAVDQLGIASALRWAGLLASSAVFPEIDRLVGELVARMREGSLDAFRRALGTLAEAARARGPVGLTAAIEALAPWLPGLEGSFAKTAVLAGACVEWGGSPAALAPVLPRRAAEAMRLSALVPAVWAEAVPGRPLPGPDDITMAELIRLFVASGARRGYSEAQMSRVALSWFDTDDWLKALTTTLMRRDFRAAVPAADMQEVRAAAAAIADRSQRAEWVRGLASVLDNEPLIALDHRSGRGFALTMSGIGDNFQLHTLLADRLIGDSARGLLPGERPDRAWVRAATQGDPRPARPVVRRFRLFDARGAYIAPEALPVEIPPVEGVRVVVIHPPRGSYAWVNGRVYEHMEPTLVLDRLLTQEEAASWLALTMTARETDLMGGNPE